MNLNKETNMNNLYINDKGMLKMYNRYQFTGTSNGCYTFKAYDIAGNEVEGMMTPEMYTYASDEGSLGWGIIGFLWPLAGWIYWGVKYHEKPKTAYDAALGAWIGFAIGFIGCLCIL